MATIVITDRRNDAPLSLLCSQMTGTLHAKVDEVDARIPGYIVLSVVAPRPQVEIACELWLSGYFDEWRVTP